MSSFFVIDCCTIQKNGFDCRKDLIAQFSIDLLLILTSLYFRPYFIAALSGLATEFSIHPFPSQLLSCCFFAKYIY